MAFRGRFPFFEQGRTYHSVHDYFKELMIKKLVFPQKHTRSEELIRLIQKMLLKDKEQRIGWKDIFSMEKIKKAVRNERKKEIISMEEFRKSMIVIANKSATDVKVIESEESELNDESSSTKEENVIIIEEAFNKDQRTRLEKKLYRSKILYTFIDIANRRMMKAIEKGKEDLHDYIVKQLQKITNEGLYYSLFVIQSLQEISGDWEAVGRGELMNF